MTYLRNFLLNFLFVFFIDRVAPGVVIDNYEGVPDIGADLLFSILVGFLNASVFPFYSLLELKITKLRLAIPTLLISFGAFAIIASVPFGIRVETTAGIFIGGLFVWIVAFVSNYMEWRHTLPPSPPPPS